MTGAGATTDSLAPDVIRAARECGATLATAESCTGGLVAAALTAVPGASDVFAGGVVAYSNDSKVALLAVDRDTLESFGAVSVETARVMADGAAERLEAGFAVSATGIAGPDGGSPDKPVGTVCMAIHTPDGTRSESAHFAGDRSAVRRQAVERVLELLLDALEP